MKSQRRMISKWQTKLKLLLMLFFIANSQGNNIDDVVKELSSVSRVVTGIAIQNTLSEKGGKVSEIVAELLNVPSGALMDQLKTAKSDSTATSLAAFENAVEQIPALRTTNVGELHNAMEILAQMRLNSSLLKNGTIKDPSDDVKALIGDANLDGIALLLTSVHNELNERLKRFQNNPYKNIKNSFQTDMREMNTGITDILDTVQKFKHLSNFYKLKEAPEMLKEVIYFGNVSKLYKDNVNLLTSLGSQSEDVKEDISGMDVMKTLNPTDTADGLRRTLEIMKSLLEERTNLRSITSGFSNGYDDIKLIKKDLKESNLLKVFSGGKSLDKMAEELSPITKFNGKMEKLRTNWREVSGSNADLATYLTVHTTLEQSKASISQLSNTDSVKGAMDKVKVCVENLKKPTNSIDFEEVKYLVKHVNKIKVEVGKFEKIVENFHKSENLNEHLIELGKWQNTSKFLSQNVSEAEEEKFLISIKIHPDILDITKVIESARNVTDEARALQWFLKSIKWDKIRPILDSLNGTGLSDALECLDSAQFDQNSLNQVLSLRSDMESLKQNTSAITSTVDYLKKVGKFTTELTSITTTNRRRRRESKGIRMENSQTTASSLGLGVQSLRDLSEIHKKSSLINKVVKLDDSVHKAVHDVEGKWDILLRTQLNELLNDFKKFDEFAGKKDKKNIPQVWSVFDEAVKIQGVEIDENSFKDPIAMRLRSDSNPTVQSAASDFESLSSLHLQFSKHHTHLTSASMTISQIQTFFNQYFGLKRLEGVNGNVTEASAVDNVDSSGWIIIIGSVLGGLGIVGALAGGSYLIYQKIDENRRWKNRERYWAYYNFYIGAIEKDRLEPYIATGQMDDLDRLVKTGRLINCYCYGYPILHYAVASQRPEMVEYLIKNGADRSLKDSRGLTASEYAHFSVLQENMKHIPPIKEFENFSFDLKKMTECVEVFKKLKGKTYRHRAPRQIEWKKYHIRMETKDLCKESFEEKYPLLMTGNVTTETHIVVDTDENGVLDLDLQEDEKKDYETTPWKNWLLLFHPGILVSSKWLKLCIRNPENFYKDHENRVTKVKFNGKVYETVDEWKKWICRRSIRCLNGHALVFLQEIDSTDVLFSMADYLGGDIITRPEDVIAFTQKEDPFLMYWRHNKKPIIALEDPKGDPFPYQEMFTADVLKKMEIIAPTDFLTWLISMNGCKDLGKNTENKDKDEDKSSKPTSESESTIRTASVMSTVSKRTASKVEVPKKDGKK